MPSFQERVIGAIRLQPSTFEDVEHDTSATVQAVLVVAATGLSAGLAGLLHGSGTVVVASVVLALVVWIVASFVVLFVGTKLFPGKNTEADFGQLLRTLGFARSPGLFSVFVGIPFLGWIVWAVLQVWILAAMVIAVRQALDYDDTLRAVVVCLVAFAIGIAITFAFGVLGLGAALVAGGEV